MFRPQSADNRRIATAAGRAQKTGPAGRNGMISIDFRRIMSQLRVSL
jgi:hypothetical protein